MTEYESTFGNDRKDTDRADKPEWKMCSLAKAGSLREIRFLSAAPQYICLDCGRVSSKRITICNPEQITPHTFK